MDHVAERRRREQLSRDHRHVLTVTHFYNALLWLLGRVIILKSDISTQILDNIKVACLIVAFRTTALELEIKFLGNFAVTRTHVEQAFLLGLDHLNNSNLNCLLIA